MFYQTYKKLMGIRRDYIYRKIMKIYGLMNVDQIKTYTVKEELRTLYSQALRLGNNCNALEIGSYLGASTCYIVAGLAQRKGHLTCVDTWNNETMPDGELDTFEEFTRNTYPIREYITSIRKNSFDLSPTDFSEQFDYVFIDGDHSYHAAKNDFCLVEKITAPKAVVLFHDALFFDGVTRTIGEALASGSWGIGGSIKNLFWIIKK